MISRYILRSICYYEVLGVSRDASKESIKEAYYKLAKQLHPDSKGSSSEFQSLSAAYETLSSDESRFEYDLKQGYLNAFDIDRMELYQEEYGTKYPENVEFKEFIDWDVKLSEELEKDEWVILKLLRKLFKRRKS